MEMSMTFRGIASPQNLKDYLGSRDLSEHLKLTKELSFHWANWDQTCLAQRRHYKNFNNNFHLMRLNHSLQELKSRPVWLCNKIKVMRTDLYSLYESYLDSRLRLTWFERKEEILFSYEGEQGPYYTLTSMKWMNKDIYAQFVMRKILLEHYTLRSFRLNSKIPVYFKLDNDVNVYQDKVEIHQLSEAGFIFKITDKNFLNKIKHSVMLELSIPISPFQKVEMLTIEDAFKKIDQHELSMGKDSMHFKLESRIINFYGNLNNAKRSSDEEFYIFARYDDLIPEGHGLQVSTVFNPLVEKTKNRFQVELGEFEELKRNKQFVAKKAA
jgi:hypothetical protein